MNSLELVVNKLKSRALEAYNQLNTLRDENFRLRAEVARLKKRIQELQSENARILELQNSLQTDLDRSEHFHSLQAKSKINELVREIDKCLALIEQ
ncbi:MAG: hypothetical protein ACK4EX_07905 [Thermaurantimonas sp.]|uniref:hypothetical protein n=1 Tax=Thermaurantimonas sp. TaxID=2681568 RepID=UPI003919BEFB